MFYPHEDNYENSHVVQSTKNDEFLKILVSSFSRLRLRDKGLLGRTKVDIQPQLCK